MWHCSTCFGKVILRACCLKRNIDVRVQAKDLTLEIGVKDLPVLVPVEARIRNPRITPPRGAQFCTHFTAVFQGDRAASHTGASLRCRRALQADSSNTSSMHLEHDCVDKYKSCPCAQCSKPLLLGALDGSLVPYRARVYKLLRASSFGRGGLAWLLMHRSCAAGDACWL